MNDTIKELYEIDSLEDFNSKIKEGINIFLLTAQWNRPGLLTEKELEKVADKYQDKIKIFKINIDILQSIPIKYNIYSFPTTLIFKKDALEEELAGYVTENTFSNKVDSLF